MTNVIYLPTYATSENTISTPPPTVSNEMLPSHAKKRKNHSKAWNHFVVSLEEEKKASCKYCGTKIKYDNGTSSMRAHFIEIPHLQEEKDIIFYDKCRRTCWLSFNFQV